MTKITVVFLRKTFSLKEYVSVLLGYILEFIYFGAALPSLVLTNFTLQIKMTLLSKAPLCLHEYLVRPIAKLKGYYSTSVTCTAATTNSCL